MINKTIGQMESEISNAIIKFEKEYLGRGPKEVKVYILGDMVLVRLKGVLTLAEEQLLKMPEGPGLIKKVRMNLLESSRSFLENMILELTKCHLVSLHTDISIKQAERIIIFILDRNFESQFKKK